MEKILLVDDEPDIIEFLRYNLEKEGYEVHAASNGVDAIKIAKDKLPHLIILDVMMPEMDGIEVCRELRNMSQLSNTLIVFLTARSEDYSHIAGLEAGADDYITKPIKPRVLGAKIKALLKRYNISDDAEDILEVGDLKIDKGKYLIYLKEQEIVLPKKEFELLLYLVSKPNKVFSREDIYHNVWGSEVVVGDRTIDVHIRKLREKIGENYITTIKGVGYKFDF